MSAQRAHDDTRHPIVQDVSPNDGTLYMHDPDGSKDAWAICETPTEVTR